MEIISSYLKDKRPKKEKYSQNKFLDFSTACASKATAAFCCNPVNVIKTRVESLTAESKMGNIDVVKEVFRNGGAKSFYRGFGATLVRDVPYSGLQFLFYKMLYDLEPVFFPSKFFFLKIFFLDLNETGKNNGYIFVIGALSSMISVMCTQPFDAVRVSSIFPLKKFL